jgi:hypothetical protein
MEAGEAAYNHSRKAWTFQGMINENRYEEPTDVNTA